MRQQERLDAILTKLHEARSLSINDIRSLTGASRDTVRRDIVKLANSDLVERNYGGISLPYTFNKLDHYLERHSDLMMLKQSLAKQATSLINDKRLLYLDVSTTIESVPSFLPPSKSLLAVTNSLDISDQLLRHSESKVRLLGGALDREKRAVVGGKPLLEMEAFEFDLSFISCAGITEQGIYYAYEEDIDFKAKIRDCSKKIALIFDHTKVNVRHNFKVYPLEDIDYFITDQRLPYNIARSMDASKLVYLKEDT